MSTRRFSFSWPDCIQPESLHFAGIPWRAFANTKVDCPRAAKLSPPQAVGRNPFDQLFDPGAWRLAGAKNDETRQSWDSLPSPYTTPEPSAGRSNCIVPVMSVISPGSWLNASVRTLRIRQMSSAWAAVFGSQSENSIPEEPERVNFGLPGRLRWVDEGQLQIFCQ